MINDEEDDDDGNDDSGGNGGDDNNSDNKIPPIFCKHTTLFLNTPVTPLNACGIAYSSVNA
jgi:hypothetical protein